MVLNRADKQTNKIRYTFFKHSTLSDTYPPNTIHFLTKNHLNTTHFLKHILQTQHTFSQTSFKHNTLSHIYPSNATQNLQTKHNFSHTSIKQNTLSHTHPSTHFLKHILQTQHTFSHTPFKHQTLFHTNCKHPSHTTHMLSQNTLYNSDWANSFSHNTLYNSHCYLFYQPDLSVEKAQQSEIYSLINDTYFVKFFNNG